MTAQYQRELDVALSAVRQASVICRSVQAGIAPDALEKNDRSPVTVADYASQAVICRALGASFPDDPVIGEEDSSELRNADHSDFLSRVTSEVRSAGIDATDQDICSWIDVGSSKRYATRFLTLDPIHGTKGFLRGEQYAISLSLLIEGRIEVAALACPNLPPAHQEGIDADLCTARRGRSGQISVDPFLISETGVLFFAVRRHGSRAEPLDCPGESIAVAVSEASCSRDARLCESVESGHSSHQQSAQVAERLQITREPVRLDSQAKYGVVARGAADIYLRLPTRKDYNEKIWDHAGGVLVVEEAGGRVTDVSGRPLEFQHGFELSANRGVVVTNGVLHDEVIRALRETGV